MNVKYLIRKHGKQLEVYAQYAVNSMDRDTPVYISALREMGNDAAADKIESQWIANIGDSTGEL
ncbi:hypothetical protein [Bacillus mycoides]|uniref:hypothetical protein n=1 Tax=Bacillus mycoides TaxID=1405 RepID=UPI0024ADCD3D|nr:hypothetical protein [Bacillus mycoides]MDI6535161.1 hypothetical protein [Bacillus mycoides]